MNTDKSTVRQLFSAERRFLVPIFQRGYVWTRAGQWEPLWRDIVEQALVVRRELLRPSRASRPARRHFLGAIVIGEDQNRVRHVPTSAVIDGQQRLTTLQVLLAALRDAAEPIDSQIHRSLMKLTGNDGDWPAPADAFKLWPTNAYQGDFSLVMTAGSVSAVEAAHPLRRVGRKLVAERPRLVDCYLYFAEVIGLFLNGSDVWNEPAPEPLQPGTSRLLELSEAVQSYLLVVTIELGREDDPQIIFATLNARGVELEASDLVRNFVFLDASRSDANPDTLYESFWKPFDQMPSQGAKPGNRPWWREKERQGRLTRERLDLFLFHYVTLRLNREIKIGHLFQEFRDWWEDGDVVINVDANPAPVADDLLVEHDHADEENLPTDAAEPRSVARELARMRRAADDFHLLLAPDLTTRLGVFASRVKRVDTTTVYPLLLWLLERRAEMPDEEFVAILRDLESYLIRRMVCGLTNKNYNTLFLNLLRKLRRQGLPTVDGVRRELGALTGESSVWPDDKRFSESFLMVPVYTGLGPVKTQLVLEALDAAMEDPRAERVVHSSLTVEHIMPQSAAEVMNDPNYPFPTPLVDAVQRAGDIAAGGSPAAEQEERTRNLRFRTLRVPSMNID